MSARSSMGRGSKRLLGTLRRRHPIQLIAIGLAVLALIVIVGELIGDLPEVLHISGRSLRQFYAHSTYLPGYGLLYVEESGVPLPAPGDVFVMYVGVRIPHNLGAWLIAWLGLIVIVLLGATNLYYLARRFGGRLVHSDLAEYVHLTPERLEKAEAWFGRWGVLAIIFGRHIPGFRVPITVAAGTLGVPYRVFAPSVAVSTAIWAGVMLTLGMFFGPRLAILLRAHSEVYFLWGAIIVVLFGSIYVRQRRRAGRPGVRPEPKRPVESPSS